jgi:hypothetical protein
MTGLKIANEEGGAAYLGQRSQAVGRTRSIGHDMHGLGVILVLVHAHDEHGSICGWGADDNLLGTALDMCGGLQRRKRGEYGYEMEALLLNTNAQAMRTFSTVVKTPVDSTT